MYFYCFNWLIVSNNLEGGKMYNLLELLETIDEYIYYLEKKHFKLDSNGFSLFTSEMFLEEEPELIIPFLHRNDKRVLNKKKAVLCTFSSDKEIYPRLKKIFKEIDIYKEYMGVVSTDVTVTKDMDKEWQELIILVNQLYAAILAVNGVKIVLNTRVGSNENLYLFKNYPKNILCISSFLGCKNSSEYDYSYLEKILYFLPSKLLIYGKEDLKVNRMLNTMGIDYKYYVDFHRLCKKGVI